MAKIDYYTLGLKPQYRFDQLVVGAHNQMAAAASLQVAKSLGESYNPLFLYGSAGVGKTHLMQAVAHAVLEQSPEKIVKYISAERFVNEIISAISEDNVMAIRQHYNKLDLLMVDDVQYLLDSKVAQSEFLHVFNNLHQQNKQVILAADRSPNQLTAFEKTIRSRFEWGLAADVKIPDLNTRIEILRLKQSSHGLQLSDEVLRYVSEILKSNVRELEGFLKRIHAYVNLSHQQLTIELVKSVILEVMPEGSQPVAHEVPPSDPIENKVTAAVRPKLASDLDAETKLPPPPPPPFVSMENSLPTVPPPPVSPIEMPQPSPTSPPGIPVLVSGKPHSNGYTNGKEIPKPLSDPGISNPTAPVENPTVSPVFKRAPMIPPVFTDAPTAVEAVVKPPEVPEEPLEEETGPLPNGFKEVGAVFFYPSAAEKNLETVHRKFQDVIKKHKLKFRLKRVYSHGYEFKGKINYSAFVEVCKKNKVPVAIVVGPPPEATLSEQEFYDLLAVTLDVQGVSLQLVSWSEIDKDYRYLNLALDIALVRSR